MPLAAAGVNVTGKPAKIGGVIASVLGWVVLAVVLAVALILGALLQAIFPPGAIVGWVVGGVIAAIGVAAALVLLLGGRFLQRSGDRAVLAARKEAAVALARNQKGIVRADAVAISLGISVADADAFLTELSRQPDSGVVLEVDSDGKIFYRFPAFAPELPWPGPDTAQSPKGPEKVRVDAPRTIPGEPLIEDELLDEAQVTQEQARRRGS